MRKALSALAATTATVSLAAAPAAQAQDAKVFQPASAWAVDYGDDYCRLMRDFSNGQEKLGLMVDRIQPGAMLRLILVGQSVSLYRGAEQIGYRLLPSGAPRTAQRVSFADEAGQQYLNLGPTTLADFTPPPPGQPPAPPPPYTAEGEKAVAAKVNGILLEQGLTKPVQVSTGALDAPIGALQTCTDELLTFWGLDAAAHRSLSRPAGPDGPSAGWVSSSTIPFSEFSKLSGGNNEFRVMIDKAGKPTACHVHSPTLDKSVNDRICGMVTEKGKFVPALDAGGQAVDSYWVTNAFALMPPFGR